MWKTLKNRVLIINVLYIKDTKKMKTKQEKMYDN